LNFRSLVIPDARPLEVRADWPRRVEQDLAALLVPLLGDVEIVLDPVALIVASRCAQWEQNTGTGLSFSTVRVTEPRKNSLKTGWP